MTYKLDPFETLLKLALSEGEFTNEFQAEVEATFNGQYATQIDPIKEAAILNRLEYSVANETVGQLIKSVINLEQTDVSTLLLQTGLAEETFADLTEDRILIDRIAIMMFKRLMNQLAIPFERLEKAVWVTYQLIGDVVASQRVSLEGRRFYRQSSPGINETSAQHRNIPVSRSTKQNQRSMLDQYMAELKEIY
ncbi:hypothetical protein GCM10023189_44910 [Nibrella saemangeumensis]|uniref:Uncharacterized protein n=1 Tax=Nibrella saemangeumensis TaxID=1084526 RepID=A0ABP8NFI7_9BACT